MTGYLWTKLLALLAATGAILFPQVRDNRAPFAERPVEPKVELASVQEPYQVQRVTRMVKIVVTDESVCEVTIFQTSDELDKNQESFLVDVPSPRA